MDFTLDTADYGFAAADVEVDLADEDENEKLQRRLLALQTVRNDFQRKDQSIAALKKRIALLEGEKMLLQQKCADTETLNARILQLERVVADRNALLQEIQNLSSEIIRLKDDSAKLEMVIVDLRLAESKSTRSIQQKEELIRTLREDQSTLDVSTTSEITTLKEVINKMKNELHAKDKKIASFQVLHTSLEEKVDKLKNVLKESKDQRQAAQAQAGEYLAEANRWKGMYMDLENNLILAKSENSSVQDEHCKLNAALQSQLRQLNNSEKKMRRSYQNITTNLSALCSEVAGIAAGSENSPSPPNSFDITRNGNSISESYHSFLRSILQSLRSHWTQATGHQTMSPFPSPGGSEYISSPSARSFQNAHSGHNLNIGEFNEFRVVIASFIKLIEGYLESADKLYVLNDSLNQSSVALEDALGLHEKLETRNKNVRRDLDICDDAIKSISTRVSTFLSSVGVKVDRQETLLHIQNTAQYIGDGADGLTGVDKEMIQRMWESISDTAVFLNTVKTAQTGETRCPEFDVAVNRQQMILQTVREVGAVVDHCAFLQKTVEEQAQTEREAATRRRTIDQMALETKTTLEEQLKLQTIELERISRERELQYEFQIAELTRFNADAEKQFSFRESEQRDSFDRRLKEAQEEYTKKVRRLTDSAQAANDEIEEMMSKVAQLSMCLEHLLWFSLSVNGKLKEVRSQKRILSQELNNLLSAEEALRVLAKGCVRMVDNSEVIITYSPVESMINRRTNRGTPPEKFASLPLNRSPHRIPLNDSISHDKRDRLENLMVDKPGSRVTSLRAVVVAVIAANRFQRVLECHRLTDPSLVSVFAYNLEPSRFNITSLTSITDNWYPPSVEDLRHTTPEEGSRLLLTAALSALNRLDANSFVDSTKGASSRHRASQPPSRKGGLFEGLTHRTSSAPNAKQHIPVSWEYISVLETTLTAMSTATRDSREREIGYKVNNCPVW
jgi:hypothetical protein